MSIFLAGVSLAAAVGALLFPPDAQARPNIKDAFMEVYPGAVGTQLDHLPSRSNHCGVCHYDFSGGGTRNPYGNALAAIGGLNQSAGRIAAINAVADLDSDGDGFTTRLEVTAAGYPNVPTFPGLSEANVGLVSNIAQSEVVPYLTPSALVDTTPPSVAVVWPNGGEVLTANIPVAIEWEASDASGIAAIHIYESIDGGQTYSPIALGLGNSGHHLWFPANRPTEAALIRVVAVDGATNVNHDESGAVFAIISPPGGRIPTTLRDFDMPGTQPFEGGPEIASPQNCASCHGNYDNAVEPYFNWQGSMMALASLDPLYEANLAIANQDAPESGDLCIRCHVPNAWLQGRSTPTDGSRLLPHDKTGVSCDFCHRMVDPVYRPGISPERDETVLGDLSNPGSEYGSGMYVVDPSAIQRGPFDDAEAPHLVTVSPFHRSSAFCGTCHDVSNPAFYRDEQGVYQPNELDAPSANFSPHSMAPVERTYSEWLNSEFNTPEGVYLPRFAGNDTGGRVATCQDCHMRPVAGFGANPATNPDVPLRPNIPLHDMTGGNTWLPPLIASLYPDLVDSAAAQAASQRAHYMLENAADLAAGQQGPGLNVRVVNQTGHKLPTGYPEGRRIWVNTRFFDADGALISESGAYDPDTAELTAGPEAKVYAVHPGIDANITELTGLSEGPSFHFVLNNKIFKDNRIPPRGFTNAAYEEFGGAPAGYSYEDGQHWDDTLYRIPAGAIRAEVRLFYQSTSKEFIEFLRDNNTTNSKGQEMYDLWYENDKCPPVLMASAFLPVMDPWGDDDGDGLSNIEELAFGSDPHDPASAARPEATVVEHLGQEYLAVAFTRVPGLDWGEVVVEISYDLREWVSGPSVTSVHDISLSDGIETVIERLNVPIDDLKAAFIRVRLDLR